MRIKGRIVKSEIDKRGLVCVEDRVVWDTVNAGRDLVIKSGPEKMTIINPDIPGRIVDVDSMIYEDKWYPKQRRMMFFRWQPDDNGSVKLL